METQAIKIALSHARIATYERAITARRCDISCLQLYIWNAQLSGAFLIPLHICEVVIRNAVAQAIKLKYGPHWPCSQAFLKSLPSSPKSYNPKRDLKHVSHNTQTPDIVIPKLSFIFWQQMFTQRHLARLWEPHLGNVMPHLNKSKEIRAQLKDIYSDLEIVRTLRNRIAHHEPIFTRDLESDITRILNLISYRCQTTADWTFKHQKVHQLLQSKPIP